MRHAIQITLLAFVCLTANAFSASDSSVDKFIENSQSGKGEWESSDAFGATTPAEGRATQQASSGASSASPESITVGATQSLVDDYIANSLDDEGEWESDDVFGASTPSQARKIWTTELQNNTTLQDNATANESTTAENAAASPKSTSEVQSLVDRYIEHSLNLQGEWESDDAFGFATPSEARNAASNSQSQS